MSSTMLDEFLAAQDEGALRLPRCDECGQFHWYPQVICPHCQSAHWRWTAVDPVGRLFSWTTVEHAFHPELGAAVPFVVGLVTLVSAPGVRLVTNVRADEHSLSVDMPLRCVFDRPVWSDRPMPIFVPESSDREPAGGHEPDPPTHLE